MKDKKQNKKDVKPSKSALEIERAKKVANSKVKYKHMSHWLEDEDNDDDYKKFLKEEE